MDGNIRQWKSGKLNSKTKVVCGGCNHSWMSEVENRTKAVIQHMAVSCQPQTLDAANIETIAQFAFLKAVVADHSHDNRGPFFNTAERYNFRGTLQLPPGFQMWLAGMPKQHGVFKSFYAIAPQNVPGRCEINAFTYGLGHFLVQTTTGRWMKKAHRRHSLPPTIQQGGVWKTFSIQVWPNPAPQTCWPPVEYLEHEILDDYAQRWKLMILNPYDLPHPTGGSIIAVPLMLSAS